MPRTNCLSHSLCRSRASRLCLCLSALGWLGLHAVEPLFVTPAAAQLQVLSQGNTDQQWRDAQLQVFDRQLADPALPDELKLELSAQRKWLAAWDPKNAAGVSASKPAQAEAAGAPSEGQTPKPSASTESSLMEPTLDPQERAGQLRERLFDSRQRPTTKDTAALQTALMEHPDDLGLRQLQMHWIDQPKYRDEYWKEISDACSRVAALIRDSNSTEANSTEANLTEDSEALKVAAAFAYYRKARALAYCLRGRPQFKAKITGVERLSDADREQMQNAIADCSRQIEALLGAGRPEFFQLELYVLRRDGWKGRALELLEEHASRVDRIAYLQTRHELLESLGWAKPAAQIASQLAIARGSAKPQSSEKISLEIEFAGVPTPAGPR